MNLNGRSGNLVRTGEEEVKRKGGGKKRMCYDIDVHYSARKGHNAEKSPNSVSNG